MNDALTVDLKGKCCFSVEDQACSAWDALD